MIRWSAVLAITCAAALGSSAAAAASPARPLALQTARIPSPAASPSAEGFGHPSNADGRHAADPRVLRLVSVAGTPGRFLAWPANHGLWSWDGGREILVGFGEGPWLDRSGHKVGDPQEPRLVRSRDGGHSWQTQISDPFKGREQSARVLVQPIRFDAPGLAVRVMADGRVDAPLGSFFLSVDRGHRWQGPFRFTGLERAPELRGLLLTSRTSYRITGPSSAQFLLSARDPRLGPHSSRLDKTFVAETRDGGRSWRFLSWVVPWSDPYRAVMPSLVDLGGGRLVAALRRRDPRRHPETSSWIDAYASDDGGRSWRFLSWVDETGVPNGNPPALTRLPDGRLACVYANRTQRRMLLRLSRDDGRSWGPPLAIRANPFEQDMGYPQLTVNHRGELVAIYYLATEKRPHSHLEAVLLQL